jgi:GT2 family glycosyltransferase
MADLSIIIVCYKGWARLNKCLEALQTYSGKSFLTEVIVVDNKSDDNTINDIISKFPEFKFIHNNVNGGFANGSNLGAANASGEYLLFLNPDTVAPENEVRKLLSLARQNDDFTILSCKQINENNRESVATGQYPSFLNLTGFMRSVFRSPKPPVSSEDPDIIFPDWVSGSVVMIKRNNFARLGGFDEDFWMYFEDVDLCRRAVLTGGKIAFSRAPVIEHNHGGSSRINLQTTALTKTEVNISRHVYISKHKSGPERILIQAFLVLNNLISGGLMALIGLLFFFNPKIFSRFLIFMKLLGYYKSALLRASWISPRSVNFRRKKPV